MSTLYPPRNRELSPRELEVLQWVAKGKTISEVAQIVGIKYPSVRTRIDRVKLKLDAVNVNHAIAKAYERGILGERPASYEAQNAALKKLLTDALNLL